MLGLALTIISNNGNPLEVAGSFVIVSGYKLSKTNRSQKFLPLSSSILLADMAA